MTKEEIRFSKEIELLFNFWISKNGINTSTGTDDFEILELSTVIFKEFLQVDESIIEKAYKERYSLIGK